MNILKYQILIRSLELGSISKAAEEMNYTQSGISHMLKSLEDEVGFSLFSRTSSGIQANAACQKLLPIIQELIHCSNRLSQTINEINGIDQGHITIGCFSSIAIHWLPSILRDFEILYPNIHIEIKEGGVDEIDQMMDKIKVDLCLYARRPTSTFDWIPLHEDPLLAVVPKNHMLAQNKSFPISAFLKDFFIAPSKGFDYDIHRILEHLPSYPSVKFSSRNDHAIIAMVKCGLGLSILPGLILKGYEDEVVMIPLDPPFYRILGIGIPKLKAATPATLKFIDFVEKYVKQY